MVAIGNCMRMQTEEQQAWQEAGSRKCTFCHNKRSVQGVWSSDSNLVILYWNNNLKTDNIKSVVKTYVLHLYL